MGDDMTQCTGGPDCPACAAMGKSEYASGGVVVSGASWVVPSKTAYQKQKFIEQLAMYKAEPTKAFSLTEEELTDKILSVSSDFNVLGMSTFAARAIAKHLLKIWEENASSL